MARMAVAAALACHISDLARQRPADLVRPEGFVVFEPSCRVAQTEGRRGAWMPAQNAVFWPEQPNKAYPTNEPFPELPAHGFAL
jgi:hypothetical protein